MALPQWVARRHGCVVRGETVQWSRTDLEQHVDRYAAVIGASGLGFAPIGLLADNTPHWIAADLAAQVAGTTLVPLPGFFSVPQLAHAVEAARMQSLFCADAARARELGFAERIGDASGLSLFARHERTRTAAGAGGSARKITFTSGTTAAPRGVRLTADVQVATAGALAQRIAAIGVENHLSLLPLSLLLENVAGVYTALMIGASCACPSLATVGLSGACRFDAERCLGAIERYRAQSVILLPQMLHALVARLCAAPREAARARSLRFAAVGGARTSPRLIARARALGLPVYEGYGLSECASVVALNVPGADRIGTVGRALPGTAVRLTAEGEIEVHGRAFDGYIDASPRDPDAWIETGDLGSIDRAGFISIAGRRATVLVTSFGRNIAPEWPEGVLLEQPSIAQAAVFGEARAFLVAVLVARSPEVADAALAEEVRTANRALPEYARIGAWLRAADAFTPDNGLATANGRNRRQAIAARYAGALDRLYVNERQYA